MLGSRREWAPLTVQRAGDQGRLFRAGGGREQNNNQNQKINDLEDCMDPSHKTTLMPVAWFSF